MQGTTFLGTKNNIDLARECVNKKTDKLSIANSQNLGQPTDEEVFESFTQGNISALGVLYDRYGLLVYRSIYRMLKNAQESEDLTQEIFINLQVKAKFNPQRGSFYTYLMTITRSRTIDKLRSKNSKGRFWQNIGKLKDHFEGNKTSSPMEIASTQEISIQVRNALKNLSPNQRQVLELSYYEGLSQSEIAASLNIPLGTVKTHSRRGLIQLRKNLNNLVNST